jgi:hypothetical protein
MMECGDHMADEDIVKLVISQGLCSTYVMMYPLDLPNFVAAGADPQSPHFSKLRREAGVARSPPMVLFLEMQNHWRIVMFIPADRTVVVVDGLGETTSTASFVETYVVQRPSSTCLCIHGRNI